MGQPVAPNKDNGESGNLMLISNILVVLAIISGGFGLLASLRVITFISAEGSLLMGVTGLTLLFLSHLTHKQATKADNS
jgi:hypothetical protein